MAFQEKLEVLIESTFDSKGLKRLQAEIGKTKAQMSTMLEGVDRAEAFNNIRNRANRAKDVFQEAGLEVSNLNNRLAEGVDNAEAMERLADAKRRLDRGVPLRESFGKLPSPAEIMEGGFDPEQFQMPDIERTFGGAGGPNIQRALLSMGVMNEELTGMAENFSSTNSRFSGFKSRASAATGAIKNMIPSTRALQMRLLGLQFTMLTVAFIFGGLMASALGAVGVFEVLGNTLKFLFLPTALNVLKSVLGFQNAIMSLGKETRQLIGDTFLWISAFAIVVGIVAALGKAVLTVLGPLSSLQGLLVATGSGGVIGGLSAIASTIASSLPPILAVIAALTALLAIFNRFPIVAKFLQEAFSFAFSGILSNLILVFENVTSIINGLLNVITGFVTLVLGLLTGQFDKARAGFEELLLGIKQIFLDTVVNIINFFIDKVNGIISMVPGIGSPLEKITSPDIGAEFGPTRTRQPSPSVQNNNISAEVQVNDKEETPQETGRKFGQGLSQGLNQRTSNISSGT